MKKLFVFSTILVSCGLSSNLFAAEWFFDFANYDKSNINWSTTLGSATEQGLWYKMEGENKVYI